MKTQQRASDGKWIPAFSWESEIGLTTDERTAYDTEDQAKTVSANFLARQREIAGRLGVPASRQAIALRLRVLGAYERVRGEHRQDLIEDGNEWMRYHPTQVTTTGSDLAGQYGLSHAELEYYADFA